MASRRDAIQEDTYVRVMRLLQDNPQLTQRQLARELGVSLGGINYCLKALIDKGWIKAQNFHDSSNKLAYAYLMTPRGVAQKAILTASFLKRKMHEFEALKAEIRALRKEL